MRKRLLCFSAVSFFIFLFCAFPLKSVFAIEKIDNFASQIHVQSDGSVIVQEIISYDFGDTPRHGIFRDLPQNGNISYSVMSVKDEIGNDYPFSVSRSGGNLEIKIGDPNKTITGVHLFAIVYRVNNAVGFFSDHDELYWNVTGLGWQIPIENSSAKITLPENMSEGSLRLACYTGISGSKEEDCAWNLDQEGNVYFNASRVLGAGEGLTVVLGWPKGLVKHSVFAVLLVWFQKFWPIFVPILVFIFLFIFWWKRGRDFPLKKPIIAEYEPPENLRPAEVGVIMNQKIGKNEISATIIDLAVRGYIKIREIKKKNIFGKDDYEIIKVKDFGNDKELSSYEKEFLRTHFLLHDSIKVSETAISFKEPSKIIYERLTVEKYFVSNPQTVRNIFFGIGIFLTIGSLFINQAVTFIIAWAFATFFTSGTFQLPSFAIIVFSVMGTGILFIIFSFFMPKRTQKGADTYWKILGFKEYINTAEKYRLQFAEKENIFEKYLPYAIIFGLSQKWAKAFEGIYNHPPSWYESSYVGNFSAIAFSNSLNGSLSNIANHAVAGSGALGGSGFGGGGFSGGGGGGGGGGSW